MSLASKAAPPLQSATKRRSFVNPFSKAPPYLPWIPLTKGKRIFWWIGGPGLWRKAALWKQKPASPPVAPASCPATNADIAAIAAGKVTYAGLPALNPFGIGIGSGATLRIITDQTHPHTILACRYLLNFDGNIEVNAAQPLHVLRLTVEDGMINTGRITLRSQTPAGGTPSITASIHNTKTGVIELNGNGSIVGDLRNEGTIVAAGVINFDIVGVIRSYPGSVIELRGLATLGNYLYSPQPHFATIEGELRGNCAFWYEATFESGSRMAPDPESFICLLSAHFKAGSTLHLDVLGGQNAGPGHNSICCVNAAGIVMDDGATLEIGGGGPTPYQYASVQIMTSIGPIQLGANVKLVLPPNTTCDGLSISQSNGYYVLNLNNFRYLC